MKHRRQRGDDVPAQAEEPEPAPPLRLVDLLPKLLPELTLTLGALAFAISPLGAGARFRDGLTFVALVEVFFCLAQGTLTDIATRLKRPPPWWLGILILGGLVLFNPDVITMTRGVMREGWPVALPFLWSLLERGRELWTMPRASRLEKLRRRALVSGRISLVLVVAGAALAVAAVSYFLDESTGGFALLGRTAGWWLAAAFGLATFDVARVHRASFARRPRALFGRFDPLGVTYLAPV